MTSPIVWHVPQKTIFLYRAASTESWASWLGSGRIWESCIWTLRSIKGMWILVTMLWTSSGTHSGATMDASPMDHTTSIWKPLVPCRMCLTHIHNLSIASPLCILLTVEYCHMGHNTSLSEWKKVEIIPNIFSEHSDMKLEFKQEKNWENSDSEN